jgi:hypothetical protein
MSPTNGRSAKRATSVLGLLSRFAQAEGLGPNPPLSAQVIEAFCVGGLRGLGSATKGTYRSVLRDLAGGPTPALATPFSASGASVPYTSAERAELVAMASAQRRPWKRHSALALLGMCLGAGARAGEAVGALGTDVDADTARITLRAKGGTLRQVPLSAPYAGIVCRRAEVVGGGHLFHPEPGDRGYPNFVNYFCAHLDGAGPALSLRVPSQLHLRSAGPRRCPGHHRRVGRHRPGGVAAWLLPPRQWRPGLQSRPASLGHPPVSAGLAIPAVSSQLCDETIGFAIGVIDASGVAGAIEALLVRSVGRPRGLGVRALLVGLLSLAIDDRPLHLLGVTKLLFCSLSSRRRAELGVVGDADTRMRLLARYRCVRYLFHLILSTMDPSAAMKNRVIAQADADRGAKAMSEPEAAAARRRLALVLDALIEASVRVCSPAELASFDGSAGVDGTPVALYSRGPSQRGGTSASASSR